MDHISEVAPQPTVDSASSLPVEPPAAPPVDREAVLVEALCDYLAEIEATQALLIDISRQALRAAIEVLVADADMPDTAHLESAGGTPGPAD